MEGKALKVRWDVWAPGFGEFKAGQTITDPRVVEALAGGQAFDIVDAPRPAEPAPSKEE